MMPPRNSKCDYSARQVHMGSLSGHRESYQRLFARQFTLTPSVGKVTLGSFAGLVRARALLFGTIDDDYFGFFAVSLSRAVLGRRTVGLFLRPQTCFGRVGLPYTLKKLAFMGLKRVPFVSVFTIVPFSVAPEYRQVATGGVVDPQVWDMDAGKPEPRDAALATHLRAVARGRRVLAFIGTANVGKGIEFLRDLVLDPAWPRDILQPVIAGRFPEDVRPLAGELSDNGALVLDRYISNDELHTLYAEAELIWACYRPDYDQASGIFGRALQYGKIPVVRAGSLIGGFARNIPVTAIELDYGTPGQASKLRAEAGTLHKGNITTATAAWRHDFETAIAGAL